MPGLARKLLVIAAVDGLFLQPVGSGKSVRIDYGANNKITSTAKPEDGDDVGLEVHGIVGTHSISIVPKLDPLMSCRHAEAGFILLLDLDNTSRRSRECLE